MNKIELIGTLEKKHKPVKFAKDGRAFEYVTIVIGLTDKKKLAINVWNDKIHQLDFFKEGEMVVVDVNVTSSANEKEGEGVYFHKVNLKTISKHDQAFLY